MVEISIENLSIKRPSWGEFVENYITKELMPPVTLNPFLGDFLIHNTPLYKVSNTNVLDGVWNAFNGSLISWLLSNKDSKFIIRQGFAGLNRLHRYQTVRTISIADYLVSILFTKSNLGIQFFSLENSKKRAFRRFNLTLQRNGGIYNEKKLLINTITKAFNMDENKDGFEKESVASQILQASTDFYDQQNQNLQIRNKIFEIFEKDFNIPASSVIESLDNQPTRNENGLVTFNGTLTGKIPISITAFLPTQKRMQTIDLIPYYCSEFLFNLLPFTGTFANYSQAMRKRLEFSMTKEANVRIQLLTKLGVKIQGSPEKILENADKHDFPFEIPVPIPKYVSKNMMITSRVPSESPNIISKEWVSKLAEGTARAMFDYNILIPNVSKSNIISEHGKVSLFKFSGGVRPDPTYIRNASKLISSKITNNISLISEASKDLNIKYHKLESFVHKPRQISAFSLFKKYPREIICSSELISGLINNAREAKLDGQIFEPFATRISKIVGESNIQPDKIVNYMNDIVSRKLE
ncbi:hypothetical protein TVAG_442170 [Trichomonas vaginalis G3]|uniref:Uncharacterized protein n=1 Tax=Trichomonas vaginalis (strain ATCC PRA-98 / G3) TaxID=412133 RepID=A2F1W1_TRIV3|nr:regulation of tocopherol cyclase protein [Trichomonas vaginalis G3]EAY01106.1 hypothetical protein TVAG_442170 [Trichomonas vaginalis G3]KAI5517423.1 regulation of tocopherol cyclase protein [Trichomonas vaginalis G3]|eukprot:XP_001313958.1 hypothetical protein [Trichomonas vaginalis G3]